MADIAIRIEGVSKTYRVTRGLDKHDTLRDHLADRVRSWVNSRGKGFHRWETFWALRDVSFEVNRGEVVGILGRNGAGKSTLLKILSRITPPSTGRGLLYGRVGSLLEVGTGFDRELTGRENIYLSGAILGMKTIEIRKKFHEIVDFSGVERFIDTPVKRYSSGMYVRLAFAVSAHLDPDILLVDEVLAVGDAAFQNKCLKQMDAMVNEGRTVIFVSHNIGAMETLCSRGIYLDGGSVIYDGPIRNAVAVYLNKDRNCEQDPFLKCDRSGTGSIRITSFHIESPDGERLACIKSGDPVVFVIGYQRIKDKVCNLSPGVSIQADNEAPLFLHYSHFAGRYFRDLAPTGELKCAIESLPLSPGNYLAGLRILEAGEEADWPKVLVPVRVESGDFYGTESVETELASWGPFLVKANWYSGSTTR